jgi:hypothetical protein
MEQRCRPIKICFSKRLTLTFNKPIFICLHLFNILPLTFNKTYSD